MADLDFTKLKDLTQTIERSGDGDAVEELGQARGDYGYVFDAAESGNDAEVTDNDLALAEDELERIVK